MRKTIAMEFFIAMALLAGMTTASDTEAPVVDSFSVTPSAIDVSSSSVEAVLEADVTEEGDVGNCDILFVSPSGSQIIEGYIDDIEEPGEVNFPSGIGPGTWQVACIKISDTLGNEGSYCNANVDFSLGDLEHECECTAEMDLSSGDVVVTNTKYVAPPAPTAKPTITKAPAAASVSSARGRGLGALALAVVALFAC